LIGKRGPSLVNAWEGSLPLKEKTTISSSVKEDFFLTLEQKKRKKNGRSNGGGAGALGGLERCFGCLVGGGVAYSLGNWVFQSWRRKAPLTSEEKFNSGGKNL